AGRRLPRPAGGPADRIAGRGGGPAPRVSPVRDRGEGPRWAAGLAGKGRHRDRDPLPDPAAPTAGAAIARLSGGRLPANRAAGGGEPLAADVPRAPAGRARGGHGLDPPLVPPLKKNPLPLAGEGRVGGVLSAARLRDV